MSALYSAPSNALQVVARQVAPSAVRNVKFTAAPVDLLAYAEHEGTFSVVDARAWQARQVVHAAGSNVGISGMTFSPEVRALMLNPLALLADLHVGCWFRRASCAGGRCEVASIRVPCSKHAAQVQLWTGCGFWRACAPLVRHQYTAREVSDNHAQHCTALQRSRSANVRHGAAGGAAVRGPGWPRCPGVARGHCQSPGLLLLPSEPLAAAAGSPWQRECHAGRKASALPDVVLQRALECGC